MTLKEYLFTVQDMAHFNADMLRTQDAGRLQSEAKAQLEKDDLDDRLFPLDHPHMTGAELPDFKTLAETVIQDLADDIAEFPTDYDIEYERDFTKQKDLKELLDGIETMAAEFLELFSTQHSNSSKRSLYHLL